MSDIDFIMNAILCAGQVSTGRMLAQLSRHYQPVTVLQFTTDGAFFISGGNDSLAITWNLGRLSSSLSQCAPPCQLSPSLQCPV